MVHKSLSVVEQPEYVTEYEIEWVKISMANCKDLYTCVFYVPKHNQQNLDQLQISLNKLTDNGKKPCDILLAEDFNCPNIDWTTGTAHSTGKD